jgi:outer membrane protein assembly factor BamE (lipoprotein component of BamABCDE complex)
MFFFKIFKIFFFLAIITLLNQCTNNEIKYSPEDPNKLTLGKVQQTLKKGMSQGEIVVALGSPNLVTSDADGLETWVYDKLSTEVNSNNSKKGFNILGGALGGTVGAGAIVGSSSKNSNTSTSQKTLTVILKFVDKKLDIFTFNASSF